MTPMLLCMTSRGPASAGVAHFGATPSAGAHKLSLFWGEGAADWKRLSQELAAEFAGKHRFSEKGQHAILTTPAPPEDVKAWLGEAAPEIYVLSMGRSIDL
jgi:amidophosphoribosyltransferase